MEVQSSLSRAAPSLPLGEFARGVLAGLSNAPKTLPCRFLYDARGSDLFERITRLPEYYPTRTEAAILSAHANDMLEDAHEDAVLVEFGSGSSSKTEILLRHLSVDVSYVAIDVSHTALAAAEDRLAHTFPLLNTYPIVADFSKPFHLPSCLLPKPKIGFFPGSTIGNLSPADATSLLRHFKTVLGPGSRLIIGVDLKKDVERLIAAYDDASGITAAFNLNLLARINREVGSEIDISGFAHKALYNEAAGRMEMHLVSLKRQDVHICGRRIRFAQGETIHTENSYKYTVEEFQRLASAASWTPVNVWMDGEDLFSVHELR